MRSTLRFLCVLLVPAMVLLACGDDDSASTSDEGSPAASDESDGETDDETDAGAADDGTSDDGATAEVGARVTVGSETFEAMNEVSCITLGGALNAQFVDDEETVTIFVAVPPPDWESDTANTWDPPSVRVDDERDEADGAQWVAGLDELIYADNGGPFSSIASFDVDGKVASGDATFIDNFVLTTGETPETFDGSFEVTCES